MIFIGYIFQLAKKGCSHGLLVLLLSTLIFAQESNVNFGDHSPRKALLRSLIVPGWGHHYIDKTDWKRGQYHMAADAVLILSYFGLKVRNNHLTNELETFANANAGINLSDRNRTIFLAIANFDNLEAYNDYQLRARNWNALLSDTPQNRWNWIDDDDRFRYQDMRERIDKNKNQLPGLITLMVANRILSGISAYAKARNMSNKLPEARISYLTEYGDTGFLASLRFGF